jgi:hypothetical protein
MFQKIITGFLFAFLFGVLPAQADTSDGCFLFKVNIWDIKKLPPEIAKTVKETILANSISYDEKFPRKHGRELRAGADGERPSIKCADIRSGKADDTSMVNKGKWARSLTEQTLEITYFHGFFKKETVTIKTDPDGIARLYLSGPYRIEVKIQSIGNQIKLYPVIDRIIFDAVEWYRDDVVSTHILIEEVKPIDESMIDTSIPLKEKGDDEILTSKPVHSPDKEERSYKGLTMGKPIPLGEEKTPDDDNLIPSKPASTP